MQIFALGFAVLLMAVGALLNTAVLVYFAWRTLRVLFTVRPGHVATSRRTLASANR